MKTSYCVIHSNYYPSEFGGVEAVASKQIEIASDIFDRILVVCASTRLRKSRVSEKVVIYELPTLFKVKGAPVMLFGNLIFLLISARARMIVFQEPFPTLWPALLAIRLLFELPVVCLCHSDVNAPKIVKTLLYKIRNFVLSNCNMVGTSLATLKLLKHQGFRGTLHHIPLGVNDPTSSDALSSTEVLAADSDIGQLKSGYALFFGRLGTYKGVSIVAEAIRKLEGEGKDMAIVIAGAGPEERVINKMLLERNFEHVSVVFINRRITEVEKNYLLSKCAVFLFPSIHEGEAFGLTQLEAMAYSKPIINTSLHTGVNEVGVDGENAWTVLPRDSVGLADAIEYVMRNPEEGMLRGINGRKRFEENYLIQHFQDRWRNLFLAVLRS